MPAANANAKTVAAPEGTFLRWLERNALRCPDKVFIHSIDQDKSITHGEMFALCRRIARYLEGRGIKAKDRVALLANNSLDHLAVYLGVLAYGATICTINVEMNQTYFDRILRAVGARLLLYERGLGLERLADEAPGEWLALGEWQRDGGDGFFAALEPTPPARGVAPVNARHDIAAIYYTSGTESEPKGVVCTFAELYDNIEPTADAFGLTADDRVLDFRSFNWVSAQSLSVLGPLCKGATLLLARKFSHHRYFDWVRTHKATIGVNNPTTINMLINRPVDIKGTDVPHLRFLTSSSAPLMVEDWKAFEKMYGIPVAQGYGTSETIWIAGSNETTRRLGSVGKPLAYQHVRIVDDDGMELPPGELGAIEVGREPSNEYCYLASDGTVRVKASGRLRTGDLGYCDKEGYLYLSGRTKDLIIRGGVNIAPVEIDNLIQELAAVAEVGTVGVPDRIYGEEVVVYIAPKPGAALSAEAVRAHCQRRLPDFKMPKEILFVDTLPKTARGKLDRQALAAAWKRSHGVA